MSDGSARGGVWGSAIICAFWPSLLCLGFSLHDARIEAEAVLAQIPMQTRFTLPHAIGDVEAGLTIRRATLRRSIARLTVTPGTAEFR